MALIDIMQRRRKLQHPQVRKWTLVKGEWGYYNAPGTRKTLGILAKKAKSTKRIHWAVAYKGKEYDPKEFLQKHPKYKSPAKRIARQIVRKKFRPQRRPNLF